jgi:hypothetical protein
MEGIDESLQEQSCNEDFRVYLEESGVMDVFTHVLVSLVLIKYKSTIFYKVSYLADTCVLRLVKV